MAEVRGQSRRDLGITALVLGFFAAAWFGWGGGGVRRGVGVSRRRRFVAGLGAGVLLAVYAAVALVRGLRS